MAPMSRASVSVHTEVVFFRPSFFMGPKRVASVVVILTFKTSHEGKSYGSNLFQYNPTTSSFRRITRKPNYEFSRGWLKSLIFGKYSTTQNETCSTNFPPCCTVTPLILARMRRRNYESVSRLTYTD